MRGSRFFFQRGSNFLKFFLVDKGREDPNITIGEPSSPRQRNAISMAFRWRADGGLTVIFVVLQGIRTNIAKEPYIFVIFQGGGGGPDLLSHPLDPHMSAPSLFA